MTIDDVWFNGWRHLPAVSRGGREGAMLDALLDGKPWNLAFDGGVIQVPDQGPLPSVMVAGGARVTLLSPVPDGLQRLRRTWQKALDEVSVKPGVRPRRSSSGTRTDRFDEAVRGGNGEAKRHLGRDQSVPNGSSIAFLFEFGHSACLFGGDAAGVLASSLRRLAAERDVAKIKLDLFKLAHHGSREHHGGGARPDRLRSVPRLDGRLEVQPPRRRRSSSSARTVASRISRTTRRLRRADLEQLVVHQESIDIMA